MARTPAVPFALPNPQAPRASPLGMPQFVVVLAGVLLVPLFVLFLLYPGGLDLWARHDVLAYGAAFGFDVGDLPTEDGDTRWGITSVTPGGIAERAGFHPGDVVLSHHGTPGGFLLGALREAAEGREACLEVRNLPALVAGMRLDRTVCLGSSRTAEPMEPTCPLPSSHAICQAPVGGAMLVWRAPVVMNGRHALVLRPSDGGPDVLVRAFERSVDVLWSPDGRAVAITDHTPSGGSTLWVHWGPLLTRQADLAALTAATGIYVGDHANVYAQRWDAPSTLRLAVGRPFWITPVPMQRFSYRLGGSPTPVP